MDSTDTTDGIRLGPTTLLHLRTDQSLATLCVGEEYWTHRAEQPELRHGRILSVYAYTETWNWWERHSVGDEMVFVLEGTVGFWVEHADGARRADLGQGECGLIPEGAWHRAEMDAPCRLLFVTPTPALTELRPV